MSAEVQQVESGTTLEAIYSISTSSLRALGPAKFAERVVDTVSRLIACRAASYFTADVTSERFEADQLQPRAAVGITLGQLSPLGVATLQRYGVDERPVLWGSMELSIRGEELHLPADAGSALMAPVVVKGQLMGLLCAIGVDPESARYAMDMTVMGLVAARVGDVFSVDISHEDLAADHEALQQRYLAMSSMYEISLDLARQQGELEPMLESVGPRIIRLLNATGGGIWLWREDAEQLELVVSLQGAYPAKVGARAAPGEGLVGQAYVAGQARVRNDYLQWAERPTTFSDAPFRSAMAIPLRWQDKVVGVLAATDDREGRDFTAYDQYLGELLASQVTVFIENAQLFSRTRRGLARTEVLYRAALTATSIMSIDETLQAVVNGAAEALNADQVVVYTFDMGAEQVTHGVRGGRFPRESEPPSFVELQQGLSGWVIRERQPAYSPKGFVDPREGPEAQERRLRNRTGAVIVAPLLYRGDLLGTMTAFNSMEGPDFSSEDVDLMVAMANQAAAAVVNAQLFEAARRRTALLSTGAEVARAAHSILDPDDLLAQVVTSIREGFALYYVGVFLIDDTRKWAVLRAGTGHAGQQMLASGHRLEIGGQSMIGACIASRQARIALDVATGAVATGGAGTGTVGAEAVRFENPLLPDTRSEMALPLVSRDSAIGAMTIQSENARAFDADDIVLLQTMADQVATAIVNARLFTQARKAAADVETNLRLFRAVIDAIPNPVFYKDRLGVYRIVNQSFAAEALGLPAEAIEGKTMLELPGSVESENAQIEHESDLALIREPSMQSYETRIRYADSTDHDVFFTKSTVLDVDGEVIGMVGVFNDITANKQLLALLQHRTHELQIAADVSRATSSILQLNELLPQAVELIGRQFGYYYVGVFLVDDTGRWAVLRAGTGEAGARMLQSGHKLEIGGQSMVGLAMQRREARIASDVGLEVMRFNNPLLPDTRSEMALPLISRGDIIGALTIQAKQSEAFSDSDVLVLQTVADQMANAIANAWLFAEAQQRFEELQRIQKGLTGEAWSRFSRGHTVVGYAYDSARLVPLRESRSSSLEEVSRLWNERETAMVDELARGEVVVQQDAQGAYMLAPITSPLGEPLGLLGIDAATPTDSQTGDVELEWSEDEIALIEAVREQIGMALENRLLFEQTASVLTETTTLYEVGQRITKAHGEGEILRAAVEGISQRPEPDRVMVALFEPLNGPTHVCIKDGWAREGQPVQIGSAYPLAYWQVVYAALDAEGSFLCSDVEKELRFGAEIRRLFHQFGVRGIAAFQLRVRSLPYGVILIYTQEPHEFDAEELRFYATLSQNTSVALENQYLLESTRQEAERRALLNEVMSTASASLDPDTLIHDSVQLIARRLEMPALYWKYSWGVLTPFAVYRFDGSALSVEESAQRLGPEDVPELTEAVLSRLDYQWRFSSTPLQWSPLDAYRDALELEELLVLPVAIRDEVMGVLVLGQQQGHPRIDANETAFLRNAVVNIGVALENAKLYQDAQETAVKLQEVDRLKSEFLANMSHELRTPLNSIIGFSRVILKGIDGPITDLQMTDLEAIYQSGRHLLELINEILDHSKIEAGKMEYAFEPLDLMEIIRGIMSTSIALVKDKPIELVQHLPQSLPTITADARRIRQVLLNLMGNAAKFTDKGFIALSASADDQWITLSVQDSGVGIPRDRFDSVFAAFEQVDSSSSRRYGGTGLGLPVSQKFVQAHGGSIWFESELGVGSTFYVKLPIEGPGSQGPAESGIGEHARAVDDLNEGPLVLTVDDDAGVITLFRRYLAKQGYRVVGLTRGDRVLEEARRLQPYAITLDVLMPDRSGWEVIQDLKSDPLTRDIPVIVCSIMAERDKGLSMGVADYLVKPILEQDLLAVLERITSHRSNAHVLVVDDNAEDRNLLRRILLDAGYQVSLAADGVEAIAELSMRTPDLVVLDLMMPEVDGFGVLESMKARDETARVPVVVVTAKELTMDERANLTQRAQALLQKGLFDQERLLDDVAVALARLGSGTEDDR